ncbi:hypothetical protein ACIBO5_41940 [Nonomuraea angiospora]|uniref:hypothetical protein n=1 Tax=Nonomuraea angiospora TaxID=46172 RepID=UPI0029ACBBCF|nr:hypothetical protein [Nonomuraea angiospora]MDX3106284.1 hypothetical protein [Nonomuraea angiospora]
MVVKPIRSERGRRISLPVVGTVPLPEPQHLAFYAVLVALGVLEIVEWPVVGIVAVGHLLAGQHRHLTLQQVGEAAEAA